jgi:DNA-binding NtrC family response regulator
MQTILLVDDDEAYGLATARHLEASGYEVIQVTTSMKALDILESTQAIDFILTDLVLEKGQPNGASLLLMAQLKRPGIKSALMSAYTDVAGDEAILPAKLLYKPLDLTELERVLTADSVGDQPDA